MCYEALLDNQQYCCKKLKFKVLKLKVYIVEIKTKHSKILLLFGTKGILFIKICILGCVNTIVCLFDLTKYIGNKMLMLIGYEPTSLNPSISQ